MESHKLLGPLFVSSHDRSPSERMSIFLAHLVWCIARSPLLHGVPFHFVRLPVGLPLRGLLFLVGPKPIPMRGSGVEMPTLGRSEAEESS